MTLPRLKKIALFAILAGVVAIPLLRNRTAVQDPLVLDDVSRLNRTRVGEVLRLHSEEDLVGAVRRARELGIKVSIAGKKHSQGGHAFFRDSMHLDMTAFDKVIAFDESEKTIRVQSGVTWKQIQDHVNPHGLAVAVMQSSNIFTVGGSLSANAHGRDPRYGPIIETVRSFRLLKADGQIVNASRTENEELFALVIGGFGLFGVILDAELDLIENCVYEKQTVLLDYREYPSYVEKEIKGKSAVGLHFARLSIDPSSLLSDGYSVTYTQTAQRPDGIFDLAEESHIGRDKFFFGLSRNRDWAKGLRWYSQQNWVDVPGDVEIVSRNNVMRPPIQFLAYDSEHDTDILQEYFIPVAQFVSFVDRLRAIVEDEQVNLLSVTLRYVPQNNEAFLNYARSDCFAVVLYINQELSADGMNEAARRTQRLVDAAHQCDGTFYLVYQRYPSPQQLRSVYPRFDAFLERKRFYDAQELFMNRFYDQYCDGVSLANSTIGQVGDEQ